MNTIPGFSSPVILTAPAAYENPDHAFWTHRVAVVFDVLRATSTIAAWLAAGAACVEICSGVREALERRHHQSDLLLIGERGGHPPQGFDCGNSPQEADPARARGRHVLMTTTNGTRALLAAARAQAVLAASLVNGAAVARYLQTRHAGQPLVIVLAGTGENFALEDAVGAAWLLHHLGLASPWTSLLRHATSARLEELLSCSANGKKLTAHGMSRDIGWCARTDVLDVVPVWMDGKLVARGTQED